MKILLLQIRADRENTDFEWASHRVKFDSDTGWYFNYNRSPNKMGIFAAKS